jgi:GTPase SAR1 family protein
MRSAILDDKFTTLKLRIDDLLKRLQRFLEDAEGPEDRRRVVSDLRTSLNEPFLFVVVGEVKSGKSSFINALLGETICRVDPAPCTDIIQQIVYAEERFEERTQPLVTRIGLPHEILKAIAIVDTPGTNTVIENHQAITRDFIPRSDLVLLVFPAKNPYTQSAWDLLDHIRDEWRKRIVFILQQADLARPDELEVNTRKVRELALQKGIPDPLIFATSAEKERLGAPDSGFDSVRRHIRTTVTGGRHYRLKLTSILDTTAQVVVRLRQALAARQERLDSDHGVVRQVRDRLESGARQSDRELAALIERLTAAYQRTAETTKAEFREGLSAVSLMQKSFQGALNRRKGLQQWIHDLQAEFERRLRQELEPLTEAGAAHFSDGLQQLLRSLIDELNTIGERRVVGDHIFLRLGRRRQEVIDAVRLKITEQLAGTIFSDQLGPSPDSLAPSLVGGGALTALGAFLLAVTHGLFFDITGGLLTGTGLVLAGGVLLVRKGRIIERFEAQLDEAQQQLRQDLASRLSHRLQVIFEDVDRCFLPLYTYVEQEALRLQPLLEGLGALETDHRDLLRAVQDNLAE